MSFNMYKTLKVSGTQESQSIKLLLFYYFVIESTIQLVKSVTLHYAS